MVFGWERQAARRRGLVEPLSARKLARALTGVSTGAGWHETDKSVVGPALTSRLRSPLLRIAGIVRQCDAQQRDIHR